MSFNAQIRADVETLDVTINNYERMANAPDAWGRIKKILAEEKFTSTNKQNGSLLCDIMMLSKQSGFTDDQRLANIQNYIMQL